MSFHGIMKMPSTPVRRPPVRNEMCFGARLAKSFAGETTLAAMFTLSVATSTVNMAMATMTRDSKWPTSSTGSHIALP